MAWAAKRMMRYSHSIMANPRTQRGVCTCGHMIEPKEIFMAYRDGDEWFIVCLTCEFWKVHEAAHERS